MIVALCVSRLYVLIVDKKIYIKMPKGVPPTVEKAFASIVPGLIITAIVLLVRGAFGATTYGNIHSFIYAFLQVPLTKLGGSWWAFIITTIAGSILWGFGIHGTMLVYSVMAPIWSTLRLDNLAAYQAGAELPHLAPGGVFQATYITIGGSGATIGLAIALVFAASKRYKTLGKLAILPSFLGINEPIMFGFPVVLNPRLLLPLILVPLTNVSLALSFTALGILPRLRGIGSPLGTPVLVNGFIEGGWRIPAFQLLLIGISFAIYYPFFKKLDNEALAEEKRLESEEASNNLVQMAEN
jgi:PTS system cellobiose-specific IIC component